MRFRHRQQAGQLLAQRLKTSPITNAVVIGLPRGGLPVALAVAEALGWPLDLLVAKKIGAPTNEEYAVGAVTARGGFVVNEAAVQALRIPADYLIAESEELQHQAAERERYLRGPQPAVPLTGKTVILVDDGIATGMTMLAAVQDVRRQRPARIIAAAPVASVDACERLSHVCDEVVALFRPLTFEAVGEFYDDFRPVSDAEARACLYAVTYPR